MGKRKDTSTTATAIDGSFRDSDIADEFEYDYNPMAYTQNVVMRPGQHRLLSPQ